MIVSALLTSVGINSAICLSFLLAYSILRKQPAYYGIYIPRLVAEGKTKQRSDFNLERLIPSTNWLKNAWMLSEEELLSSSGLDAVVFIRIVTFSLKVLLFAGVIGIFVLLPVNCSGDQLQDVDIVNISNNSLDVFTISNVKNGSHWLWIHFSAVYLITAFICCLLYYEYDYISSRRIEYFCSSKPLFHHFTILVRAVPASAGRNISDSVENFFTEYHPSTYLSHTVVRRTSKLRGLINDAKTHYRRLVHLQSIPTQVHSNRGSCFGLFRRKVDLVDRYGKRLGDIEQHLRLEQSQVSLAGKEVPAAFVSFKSRYGAAIALNMQQSNNPIHWVTEQAPEPDDVYWPFFSSTFMQRWISKLGVAVACFLLTVLFFIPVFVVQGLTNLNQLEIWFPFLKSILTVTFINQIITGYLPSLILQLFLKVVPPVMECLSSIQGYISLSDIKKSACFKVLWFTIWNIFFATVFSGTALLQLSLDFEPKTIPTRLAVAVPAQASFFVAYVVTSGWTTSLSELINLFPLISSLVTKPFSGNSDVEPEVPAISYQKDIPRILFFVLLGVTYFFLAPLILPFLLVYFSLEYIVYCNQFINVYAPKYETAGKFWPIAHNCMIFSLVLMHAIAVGIFTLKGLPLASSLLVPLPILTLLFNEYCRKRFLPNFSAYSAETLIKKDRADESDPAMAEFLDKMVTTYHDPALMPLNFTANSDGLNRPLMSSAED